jgi:hypothetical protein
MDDVRGSIRLMMNESHHTSADSATRQKMMVTGHKNRQLGATAYLDFNILHRNSVPFSSSSACRAAANTLPCRQFAALQDRTLCALLQDMRQRSVSGYDTCHFVGVLLVCWIVFVSVSALLSTAFLTYPLIAIFGQSQNVVERT